MIFNNLKPSYLILLFFFATACASSRTGVEIQKGEASWYGPGFHGKKTANGETFNKNKFTAAHRTLPFNTLVKVINTENGKSVLVRINDRGPYAKDRILDLSEAAAEKIGLKKTGTAFVSLVLVKGDIQKSEQKISTGEQFSVQIASFSDKKSAQKKSNAVKDGFYIKGESKGNDVYRVFSGKFSTKLEAENWLKKLKAQGIDGFVKQL
jgi:rare lipoprotein A